MEFCNVSTKRDKYINAVRLYWIIYSALVSFITLACGYVIYYLRPYQGKPSMCPFLPLLYV